MDSQYNKEIYSVSSDRIGSDYVAREVDQSDVDGINDQMRNRATPRKNTTRVGLNT